ncbi:polymeric immunoglobulin receptor-like [Silurus asotus]|nr:polymeric immunoglobulin receptor-like [Silurus asotus]
MKSKSKSVYTGTEGGSVEISCKYPDGYQYTPMYFCRDPCTTSEVLITCEKVDIVVTKKRYSAVNTASAHTFSVTIRHLTLKDSGVYYCGVNKWGFDKLTKVKLTISTDLSTAVPTVSTLAPETRQNQSISVTQFPPATTAIPGTQGYYLFFCGGLITLCCVLAALVVIYRKTSTDITFLICATLKSKAESKFTGTEGGSVDISCKYSDGYQYTPMYFCRDPCTYSDLLIKCKKADTFVSKGRYSAINTVSGRRFSVAIKNLTLQDSGVYYCGVSTWGFDKLTKVKLTVSKVVPAVSTFAPVSGEIQMSEVTELPITITVLSSTAIFEQSVLMNYFWEILRSNLGQILALTSSEDPDFVMTIYGNVYNGHRQEKVELIAQGFYVE